MRNVIDLEKERARRYREQRPALKFGAFGLGGSTRRNEMKPLGDIVSDIMERLKR